jgi:pyrroline-5-carboxylate reductase
LAEGAAKCGVPAEMVVDLAAGTVLGAAKMVLQGEKEPAELRQNVCSPGGSTIEGVKSLEAEEFRAIVYRAIEKSYIRTKELGK